jgi:hypothetical protein
MESVKDTYADETANGFDTEALAIQHGNSIEEEDDGKSAAGTKPCQPRLKAKEPACGVGVVDISEVFVVSQMSFMPSSPSTAGQITLCACA